MSTRRITLAVISVNGLINGELGLQLTLLIGVIASGITGLGGPSCRNMTVDPGTPGDLVTHQHYDSCIFF